jgi:hypothetical protein
MLRNRLLILAGGCLLAASAARADGVGYIDCSAHPEETQVFAKPRQTHETVASIPCGERFTIVLYGFIFSRIQTKDGQVGYVYSNLIAMDRSGAPVQSSARPATTSNPPATASTLAAPSTPAQPRVTTPAPTQAQAPAATSNPPVTTARVAEPNAASATQAAAKAETTSDRSASKQTPAAASKLPDAAAVAAQVYSTAPPETPAAAATPPASTSEATSAAKTSETPTSSASAPAEATKAQAAAAQVAEAKPAKSGANVSEAPAATAQPEASAAAQPAAAEPPARPIRPVEAKESWEKPNKGYRTVGFRRIPLIELFGGYGFARFDGGGGTITNLNGVLGSFGWNIKPWLQLVADTSYNVVTISGTKNVLYGNHWGPRIFSRTRNKWGLTPFVEGLVGGSRLDVTVTGASGYTTSQNVISYKVGGGVDMKSFRHWEVRVVDFDYYRTSFGTGLHQNNYSVSTGIVLRLFGGSE